MRVPPWIAAVSLAAAVPAHAGESAGARAIERIEARFPKARGWFGQAAGIRFDRREGGLTPDWSTIEHPKVLRADSAGQRIRPVFPLEADDPHTVGLDGEPGLWVRVTPLDAAPVAAEIQGGLVVYPGAYGGADLVYKLTPTRVDEYLYVPDARGPERFRFRVELGPAVRELRPTTGGIEVVDVTGSSRLRIGAPFARGADGARRDGTLELDGAVLALDVPLKGMTFPVLIDPDWTTTGRMVRERFLYGAYTLLDGSVLAAAGCSLVACPLGLGLPACSVVLGTVERYRPESGTWSEVTPLATPRFAYAGTRLHDGRVLVAGGCTQPRCTAITDTVEIWDPDTGRWSFGPPLGSPRAFATATQLPDGSVLVTGGCDIGGCTASTERYVPRTGAWKTVGSLATARGFHQAAEVSKGRVLVTGGCSTLSCTSVLDGAELFDPVTEQWSPAGVMGVPRAGHSATSLGTAPSDGVLVAGGCARATCIPTLATAERWIAPSTFTPVGSMAAARHDHSSALLADKTVLVAGGCSGDGTCTRGSEVYDPAGDRWAAAGALGAERAYAAVSVLSDGRVLFTGGCNFFTCLPWAETYPTPGQQPADGGVPPEDAAVPPADATTLAEDAALPAPSADTTVPPEPDAGPGALPQGRLRVAKACDCSSTHGPARSPSWLNALFALFALAGLARRRSVFASWLAVLLAASSCAGSGEGLDLEGRPIRIQDAGPIEDAGAPDAGPPVDPRTTFTWISENVFSAACTRCHSGATSPAGLVLDAHSAYDRLVGVESVEVPELMRVDPFAPDDSYLLVKIAPADGRRVGLRMPRNGPPYLSDTDVEAVRGWIARGAPRD